MKISWRQAKIQEFMLGGGGGVFLWGVLGPPTGHAYTSKILMTAPPKKTSELFPPICTHSLLMNVLSTFSISFFFFGGGGHLVKGVHVYMKLMLQ